MKAQTILLVVSGAILMILGVIFLIASVYEPTRIVTGLVLVGAGLVLLFYARKTSEAPQKYVVELPSQMKVEPMKCPNCGGEIPIQNITVVSGITRATCPYCGNVAQISEEPKW
jgi:predicted RNA-binding Zn-ribbon protein involved in translation (DUF1610 family)